MNKQEVFEHLNSLTPTAPYSTMIKNAFDVDVPPGMPVHQQEHLYRSLMIYYHDDTKAQFVTESANKIIRDLLEKFPWLTLDRESIIVPDTIERNPNIKPETADYADGTILYCAVREKYVLYLGGKIVVRCKTLDAAKHYGAIRHNCNNFNFVED